MPVGVVGANFSAEYYRVIDDRKRRVTLQQQIKTMNAVEEEQDKALQGEFGQVDEDIRIALFILHMMVHHWWNEEVVADMLKNL